MCLKGLVMDINYKAYIYSKNKMVDNKPVWLKVGIPVKGKFRWVQELSDNATASEMEWYKTQVLSNVVEDR